MTWQEPRTPSQERAWILLGSVANHSKVRAWLQEADRSAPSLIPRALVVRRVMAASIVVALMTALVGYVYFQPAHYETTVGEQRDVLLSDGSRITLNTNTSLDVRYRKTRRYIELKRGEALFSVHHDAQWPFVVSAGGTATRALGTEFNVDVRNLRVTISVLEGAVQVAAKDGLVTDADGASNVTLAGVEHGMATLVPALSKGESVEIRPQERRVIAGKADLRRIDAWRARRLEFGDTPLAIATAEFNRYSTTKVIVGSSDLEAVRVSGMFQIGNVDGFVFALKEALGVSTIDSPGEVVLVRGKSL